MWAGFFCIFNRLTQRNATQHIICVLFFLSFLFIYIWSTSLFTNIKKHIFLQFFYAHFNWSPKWNDNTHLLHFFQCQQCMHAQTYIYLSVYTECTILCWWFFFLSLSLSIALDFNYVIFKYTMKQRSNSQSNALEIVIQNVFFIRFDLVIRQTMKKRVKIDFTSSEFKLNLYLISKNFVWNFRAHT